MIKEEVPGLKINAWNLAGSKAELHEAVDIIFREGPPPRGLFLLTARTVSPPQIPKSTVWCPSSILGSEDPLERGIPRIQEKGIVFLGTPIGDLQFTQNWIRLKIEKVRDVTAHLPLLQDAHVEFVLLRSCLTLPKVMFILRTTDPTSNSDLWVEFDSITKEALTRILGSPMGDTQWSQKRIPTLKKFKKKFILNFS